MRWSSASLLLLISITACAEPLPQYRDLAQASTRKELREKFGEPDFIRSGNYQPDVVSLNDPPLIYTHFEYWEYLSSNNGESGKAFFSFYTNEHNTEELLGDKNWLSDADLNLRIQR